MPRFYLPHGYKTKVVTKEQEKPLDFFFFF